MEIDFHQEGISFIEKKHRDLVGESVRDLLLKDQKASLDKIWRAATTRELDSVTIHIVPLERVGAPAGASGSRVFIAYFSNKTLKTKSIPLILKFNEDKDKLKEENERYQQIREYIQRQEYFAEPIFYNDYETISILWSPFTDKDVSLVEENLQLNHNDLSQFLNSESAPLKFYFAGAAVSNEILESQVERIFTSVFKHLKPFHIRSTEPEIKTVNVGMHYKEYLRVGSDAHGNCNSPDQLFKYITEDLTWTRPWIKCWGKEMNIDHQGSKLINPIFILQQVINLQLELKIGAIHGDLHPKNIILNSDYNPYIIDFGWASDEMHILADFSLMEANLRFMTLHHVPDAKALDQFVAKLCQEELEYPFPEEDQYLNFRRNCILKIRKNAFELYSKDSEMYDQNMEQFEKEYLISLFIISFGLLKFIDNQDFNNMEAARKTILHLANSIHEKVF